MTNAIQTDNRTVETTIKDHLARVHTWAWEPNLWTDPNYIEAKGHQLLADAARVILQGYQEKSRAPYIRALAGDDLPLRVMLEDITRNHRPPQEEIDKRRKVSDAVGQFVDYMEALAEKDERDPMPPPEYQDGDRLGVGEFADEGVHTCRFWTYETTTFWSDGTEVTELYDRVGDDPHNCPACLENRAVKMALQALREAHDHPMFYGTYTPKDTRLIKQRGKKRERRAIEKLKQEAAGLTMEEYRRRRDKLRFACLDLPQEDGRSVLIHNDPTLNDKPFPIDKAEAQRLLVTLCKTPEGQRLKPTEGFGKEFQGMRGDGRIKYAQQKQRVEEEYDAARAGKAVKEQDRATGGNKTNAESAALYRVAVVTQGGYGGRLPDKAELLGAELVGARRDRGRIVGMSPEEIYARKLHGGYVPAPGDKQRIEKYRAKVDEYLSGLMPTKNKGKEQIGTDATPAAPVAPPEGPPEPPQLAYLPGIGDF